MRGGGEQDTVCACMCVHASVPACHESLLHAC